MTSTKIKESDIAALKVASLPSRPTAPRSFGGAGYTATEMKQAFDRLPLYIIARFNELIDDLGREGEDGAAAAIPTGIKEGHTLAEMMSDVKSGAFAAYLDVLGMPLSEAVATLRESISRLSDNAEDSASDAATALGRIAELEGALEVLSLDADEVRRSLTECLEKHAALEARHEGELEALKSEQAAELAAIGAKHDTDANDLAERITMLEDADAATRLDTLDSHLYESERRLESLEVDARATSARLDALESGSGGSEDMIIDCGGPEGLV